MSHRFHEAVADAIKSLKSTVSDGKLNFPPSTFAVAVRDFGYGINMSRNAEGKLYYVIDDAMADCLVSFAKTNPQFFDLVVTICRKNWSSEMSLPKPLMLFAIDNIGENNRPTPKHRERAQNWIEKAFLRALVQVAVSEFDLTMTRNEATASKASACDAIAAALTTLGRKTTYGEIANLMVHRDHAQFRLECSALEKLNALKAASRIPPCSPDAAQSEQTIGATAEAAMAIYRTFPSSQK